MSDYIPRPDAEFIAWLENFLNYAAGHTAGLGLVAADLTPAQDAAAALRTAFADHNAAQAAAQSARQAKDAARIAVEQAVRGLSRRLQVSPQVDDAERAALGLTVRDAIRTAGTGAPATCPVAVVDASHRLRHDIRFFDQATPTRRAKPPGVLGCEIWVKVTPTGQGAPADPSDLTFLGLDTASPYTAEYDGADAGKTAHYMLRWAKANGEKGPWSETVSATIGG